MAELTIPAHRQTSIPNAVLGTGIFLVTEVMVFIGLIASYLVIRSQYLNWPPVGQPRLPIEVTAINTLILLVSGVFMWRAVGSVKREGSPYFNLWMTLALGVLFLLIQGYEWIQLLSFGMTASGTVYGATFYTLIGVHAAHLVAAVLALLFVTIGKKRSADLTILKAMSMYWYFVVLIWPVLYVLVYLC